MLTRTSRGPIGCSAPSCPATGSQAGRQPGDLLHLLVNLLGAGDEASQPASHSTNVDRIWDSDEILEWHLVAHVDLPARDLSLRPLCPEPNRPQLVILGPNARHARALRPRDVVSWLSGVTGRFVQPFSANQIVTPQGEDLTSDAA